MYCPGGGATGRNSCAPGCALQPESLRSHKPLPEVIIGLPQGSFLPKTPAVGRQASVENVPCSHRVPDVLIDIQVGQPKNRLPCNEIPFAPKTSRYAGTGFCTRLTVMYMKSHDDYDLLPFLHRLFPGDYA